MRPPTVRRRSGAPSFGQCAPGLALRGEVAGVRAAAAAEDAQRVADRAVQPPRVVVGRACRRRRAGSMPARHSTSSHSRLPRPAIRDWSMITALIGARLLADDRAQLGEGRASNASGPRRSSSGSSSTAPSRRGSRRNRLPPSANAQPEAVPRATPAGCSRRAAGRRRLRRRPARGRSCRDAGRAPRPLDVSTSMSLPRRRACTSAVPATPARTARRREPALEEPRVRCVHLRDRTVRAHAASISARADSTSRISGKCAASVAERTAGQALVIAPRSAPWASLAYLARNPLV